MSKKHTEQQPESTENIAEEAKVEAAEQAEAPVQDLSDETEDELATLQEEIASLNDSLASAKDQALRMQAEAQNARRRAQLDVEKAHKFAVEKLLKDLLPVVDNLERALAAIDREDEAMKAVIEGIELTHKSFMDTLAKNNVETVDPAGQPFDPELHQAMTQVPNPDLEPNTVMDVFQKGYTLHGRLVRPAMVVVSKAP